jgi:hypothetical protein
VHVNFVTATHWAVTLAEALSARPSAAPRSPPPRSIDRCKAASVSGMLRFACARFRMTARLHSPSAPREPASRGQMGVPAASPPSSQEAPIDVASLETQIWCRGASCASRPSVGGLVTTRLSWQRQLERNICENQTESPKSANRRVHFTTCSG